ncbi:MAG: hypothetical protein A2Y17_00910 [Clostridiales bacterium GWF2_38_85]|nr:MAG: hypothetical protein A2Y17_00910 [Clostridiales bacterium GWF2_38_85]HBL84547.1 class I SAM-dependent methyltransferase [Clostridiales bacterium]
MKLEKMDEFFDKRADTYDHHMLVDLQLDEFYEEVTKYLDCSSDMFSLLDLGCGTGLELERLFKKYPNIKVTGIDLSQEMLNVLKQKYAGEKLNLICGSYFDINFSKDCFDYALSTYSLHHFDESTKISLYKKIYNALKPHGIYIEGDYTCKTINEQLLYIAENEKLRMEQEITNGFYHYDTPFTVETQMKLLKSAGFSDVKVVKEWDSTSIIVANKL